MVSYPRSAIEAHFAAAGRDEVAASEIYADDAVLDFPQGGERIRGMPTRRVWTLRCDGRSAGRTVVERIRHPNDGKPSHVVGIMEFRDAKVIRETIYVGEPWDPPNVA